ncbi:DUF4871 domain-containing protein [Paenibacillus sp. NPDC058071]|uniref:DUF4871 domain-containing protein n=1 Tax=Paenibacillus sp. NPDC058071 TaxID=3346326 RepID=UPI0036DC7D84
MNDQRESGDFSIELQLRETPFRETALPEELKTKIRLRAARTVHSESGAVPPARRRSRYTALAGALAAAAAVLLTAGLWFWQEGWPMGSGQVEKRTAYMQDGIVRFELFPGGEATAGQRNGLLIVFKEPYAVYKDKVITVNAEHVKSGRVERLVENGKLKEPAESEQVIRYGIPDAGLPLGGEWRVTVEVDGRFYGDAVIDVPDGSWEDSPVFSSPPLADVRGTEGRLALLEHGFIAGQPNKYMWLLWGGEEELTGRFEAFAVKKGSNDFIELFLMNSMGTKQTSYADRYFPSTLMLPEPGQWRIVAYVDGKLFGSIVVTATEPVAGDIPPS